MERPSSKSDHTVAKKTEAVNRVGLHGRMLPIIKTNGSDVQAIRPLQSICGCG
jgi:hypothetical protein